MIANRLMNAAVITNRNMTVLFGSWYFAMVLTSLGCDVPIVIQAKRSVINVKVIQAYMNTREDGLWLLVTRVIMKAMIRANIRRYLLSIRSKTFLRAFFTIVIIAG